ncbi:MAG: hypothetical protein ACKVP7_15450 [Hyphomicrobiaceae bacterium]
MIYVVEMDFRDAQREHDWHTWYLEHVGKLIRNVPGFRATQRFRALTTTASPWLAMHEVAGPEVFKSAEYAANGGPASTGEWKDRHTNWYRNLFDGVDVIPAVPHDAHLLMGEGEAKLPAGLHVIKLASAGLDKTSEKRSIAIVPEGRLTAHMLALPGVRVFKPITPQIRGS